MARDRCRSLGHYCSLGVHVLWVRAAIPPNFTLVDRIHDASLATNIIVSSMLILGGSATVTSLTGMNTIAVSKSARVVLRQH